MKYLSPEWLAEAGRRLADLEPSPDEVTVAYAVAEGDSTSRYAVRLGPGPVVVLTDPADVDAADVSFSLDRTLADQIARGERSASSAFLDGELRLGGDINVLLAEGARLAKVDDLLADIRPEPRED